MVLPNHGNPSTAEGTHVSCNHLAVPVNPEPVSGLFENEVRQAGLGHLLEEKARPGGPEEGAVPGPGRPEAEGATRALDTYNVFSTVPPEVAELSELLYWNSGGHAIGATGQGEGGGHSRLSALFARERRLALVRGACEEALAGARLTHLFDAVAPGATERLFCGGVYSSSGDAVEALKADCAAAFTAHPQYRAILQKRNELYTRLNRAMQRLGRGEEEASRESPEVPRPAGAREPGPSGALSDALKRKEQYLRQVATEGLAKLQSCLAQQSETLTETLCLRVWGDVVYWELARGHVAGWGKEPALLRQGPRDEGVQAVRQRVQVLRAQGLGKQVCFDVLGILKGGTLAGAPVLPGTRDEGPSVEEVVAHAGHAVTPQVRCPTRRHS